MTRNQVYWYQPLQFLVIVGATLAVSAKQLATSPAAMAQRIPIADDTLGDERSIVSPDQVIRDVPSNRIDGGARRGDNLFHSFEAFNIEAGRGAYFSNPAGVDNILARVTGNSQSDVLGRLGVLGDANLFLLNPNGILFGRDAQLDIRGSFLASTANRFSFPDGSEFSATTPQAPPLLTINVPLGLQSGAISSGSTIANLGNLTTGQDLTLEGDRLDLQGQLVAGRDLTLTAQDTLQIRDITAPFLAGSGRDLTIQGNQGVDILALNHPQIPLQSGRNLTLSSDGVISGDAHFSSGGNFQIRSVSGQLATFTSLYDPIISSTGDVDIAANYGSAEAGAASLLIESQGSVRIQGEVAIEAPDTVSPFVGSDAVLATRPGLIIRSGQTSLVYGGTNQANPPAATNGTVPAGITLDNPVRVQPNVNGGIVELTADNGGITFHSIDASSTTEGNGGGIALTAQGTITNTGSFQDSESDFLPAIALGSFSFSGNGANISLVSTQGDIVLNNGAVVSRGGNGGAISLSTYSGNISLSNSDLSSSSNVFGEGGNGGAISLLTHSGNISLSSSEVYSPTLADYGGSGGSISFSTHSGNISLSSDSNLYSYVFSFDGDAGKAGAISFSTHSGNISLSNLFLNARSIALISGDGEEAGAVSLFTHSGSIFLTNALIYSNSGAYSPGNAGTGGEISVVTQMGDVILIDSQLTSSSNAIGQSETTPGTAGTAGAILISAREGSIAGRGSTLDSFAVSDEGGSSGNGGTVILEANSGISGLTINTVASGGQSGAVQIHSFGNLVIDSVNIQTAQIVEFCTSPPCTPDDLTPIPLNDRGQAGNVTVDSIGNLTFGNSVIQSDTRGGNPAGNITIRSPGVVSFNNSQITSNTSGVGNAGNINIDAPVANLTAQSQIQAQTTTESRGNGGSITITAPTSVSLTRTIDGNPVISVETNGAGRPGDITINTPSLSLSERARITATATATATNRQGGGSITLNASNLNLAGIVGVFAETQGQAPAGTLRLSPYRDQPDLDITLTPNSQISASTSSSGRGGDLIVTAPRSIAITGSGRLSVETSGTGNAGNISFATGQLSLNDGVEISASTSGIGQAGDIGINAQVLTLSGGAQISTDTSGTGSAGDLTVRVRDRLFLTGRGTGLFASTTADSTGNGGNIAIDPQLVQIEDGAAIAVDSQGRGTGGNISLQGDRLVLNQQGSITAETRSAQGGNISLDVSDVLLLRRNSVISATAGTAEAGGDGGNISFDGQFIVAVPNENSDISANAFTGRGGSVDINAQNLFGIQARSEPTSQSDITASSEAGVAGVVSINTPDVDPSRGLVELPADVTDASRQIAQTCPTGGTANQSNEFIVTGRGGLPPTPDEAVNQDAIQVELVAADAEGERSASQPESNPPPQAPLVEAQGMQVAADGSVILVAAVPQSAIAPSTSHPAHCY